MMVVVFHYIGWHGQDSTSFKIAAFIFNGPDAVSFFFVLSGFVLAYPYLQLGRQLPYGHYLIRRIMRLYPAYIILILLLALGTYYTELSGPLLKEIFLENGRTRIWNELAMVLNVHDLYFPGWTLRIEMIYSLLMPILIFIALRKKTVLLLVWLGSLFIGDVVTRMCMTHFLLGLSLAYYYPQIKAYDFKTSKWHSYRGLLYLMIFMLFSLRNIYQLVPQTRSLFDNMWQMNIRWEHFSAVAAFLIIIQVILNKETQQWLEKSWLLYLGKISYSIYLIHWLVIKIIMHQWEYFGEILGTGSLRFGSLLFVYIGVTIVLAHFMYHWIEKPFIRWSKLAIYN